MGAAQPRTARPFVVWSGLRSSSSAGSSQPCRTPTTHDASRKLAGSLRTATTQPSDFLPRCLLAGGTVASSLVHADCRTVFTPGPSGCYSKWTLIHHRHFCTVTSNLLFALAVIPYQENCTTCYSRTGHSE